MNHNQLVLILGSTGASGFHVAHTLLNNGYHVRVIVRSKARLMSMFSGKQQSFQKIIQGNFNNDKVLEQAFKPSQTYGKVKYVISTLGVRLGSKENMQQVEYTYQKKLIDKSKQAGIQKYIFESAFLMTRPQHSYHKSIDKMLPNCYYWKAQAQNYLRKSGLNYIIIRPPNLLGYSTDFKVTGYELIQGDNHTGGEQITRSTVAEIIRKLIQSKQIPNKVTFVCVGSEKPKLEYSINSLKADNTDSIVKLADHPPN